MVDTTSIMVRLITNPAVAVSDEWGIAEGEDAKARVRLGQSEGVKDNDKHSDVIRMKDILTYPLTKLYLHYRATHNQKE
jgi:hypothetical protein